MPSVPISELLHYSRNFEREAVDRLAEIVNKQGFNDLDAKTLQDAMTRTFTAGGSTRLAQEMSSLPANSPEYKKAAQKREIMDEDLAASPAVKKMGLALHGLHEGREMRFGDLLKEANMIKERAVELVSGLQTLRERGISSIDLAQDLGGLKTKQDVLATLEDAVQPFLQPEEQPTPGMDNNQDNDFGDRNPRPQPKNRPGPTFDM